MNEKFTLNNIEERMILNVLDHLRTPNYAADVILKRAGKIAKYNGRTRKEVINAILSNPGITGHAKFQSEPKIASLLQQPQKIRRSPSDIDEKTARDWSRKQKTKRKRPVRRKGGRR